MASLWLLGIALLRSGLASAGTITFQAETGDLSNYTIPSSFLFGAGSSNYQCEGAWNVSDKGMGVLDHGYHTQTRYASLNHIGDVAADAYHHVDDDIALMKQLKFDVYRFSISWPRILPKGTNDTVSATGVKFYSDYIDKLIQNGVQPLITLHHFDHPQVFEDEFSSWLGSEMIDRFVDYADFAFKTFGDRVKIWTTINEANMYCSQVYSMGQTPPGNGTQSTSWYYTCLHNMQVAHARVYHLYQEKYKSTQQGTVGFGCLGSAAECLTPVIFGDYTSSSSGLVPFTDAEKALLRNSTDYIALNYYGGGGGGGGGGAGGSGGGGMGPDGGGGMFPPGFNSSGGMGGGGMGGGGMGPGGGNSGTVSGDDLMSLLVSLWQTYSIPIFITENGEETSSAGLQDQSRAVYCSAQLRAVTTAINYYGVPVMGYTLWSFTDDFEFSRGFNSKYGMVHVDFDSDSRTRTLKDSSEFFIKMQTDRIVPLVTSTTDSTSSVVSNLHNAPSLLSIILISIFSFRVFN